MGERLCRPPTTDHRPLITDHRPLITDHGPPIAAVLLLVSLGLSGCRAGEHGRADDSGARAQASTVRAAVAKASPRPRIVALGDSLTAGLGLDPASAYPALLQERVTAEHLNYEVINAGVSGDTSAGGLSRLEWALDGDVRVLIVALGGNDGLRALPPDELKQNLAAIEKAQARHITVVLAGMEAPPNFGRDYVVNFHRVYPQLASTYHLAFVPFLLEGVAGSETLNQRDGIHPTAEGARRVADNIWTVLRPIVAANP
jgi:acyl-CoA thioesterase I